MTVCIPTQDGLPYVQWINTLFGDCVYGTQDAISLLLGYCSILFWLNAQLPQVVENYKMGSADCLSLNFLSIWLAGDAANLIGAILTHQLPFQLYLGIYFVSIDICLLCQWVYYSKFKSSPAHHNEYLIIPTTIQDDDYYGHNGQNQNKPANSLFQHPAHTPLNINTNPMAIHDEFTPFSSSASPSKWYTLDNNDAVVVNVNGAKKNSATTRLMGMLLFTSTLFLSPSTSSLTTMSIATTTTEPIFEFTQDNVVWIGRIFAWTCTSLYLMSRIPQLLKNRRRQSVEGLSASLFAFAACGNLTYASSILTHPGQTTDSLLEALPYLIGSAGTLVFDFSIFCQFLYYRKNGKKLFYNKINTEQVVV